MNETYHVEAEVVLSLNEGAVLPPERLVAGGPLSLDVVVERGGGVDVGFAFEAAGETVEQPSVHAGQRRAQNHACTYLL